jgi:DGQHR domain-containing protein
MREYLNNEKRVFVNNVIVTFPEDVKLLDSKGAQITASDATRRTEIEPVTITLPKRLGSIGIIDGQHRIFAYHEGGDKYEQFISQLRERQHLLVTGIIHPPSVATDIKQQFEARLFLEINDKQKKVQGDLKQAIEMIVRPRTSIAIAKAVISKLATQTPLIGIIPRHAFDTGKLKTTSIVSYGLKYVVDPARPVDLPRFHGRFKGEHNGSPRSKPWADDDIPGNLKSRRSSW